jgi:hypothetical protein
LKKRPKGSVEFLCRAQNFPKNSAIPRRNSKPKKNLKVLPNPTKSKGEPLKNHRLPHASSPPGQEAQRNCCGVGNNPEDLIDGRMKTVGAVQDIGGDAIHRFPWDSWNNLPNFSGRAADEPEIGCFP